MYWMNVIFHIFVQILMSIRELYIYQFMGIVVRVFTNGPRDQGSIPGWVIPKTKKMVLDTSLLNTQHYKVWNKSKWSNPGNNVAPFPTPWCSSYWKVILTVSLDSGWPTYIHVCMYVCICQKGQCMYVFAKRDMYVCMYVFAKGTIFRQTLTSWIQSFPSPRLVAIPRLKCPVYPTIYP